MTNLSEIYFHGGLSKTGSTYLQYKFFPKLKNIQYIQRTKYKGERYLKIINKSESVKFIISAEFDHQLEKELINISSNFPNVKFILVFRKHSSWIASQYRRYIKNAHSMSFSKFFDLENDSGPWKQADLYYMKKIKLLEKYLVETPLLLNYEDIKTDPYVFFNKISDFTGSEYEKDSVNLKPKHKSYNEKQLKVIRKLSRCFFPQKDFVINNYALRQTYRYLKMIPRTLILYSVYLIPNFLMNNKPLIPEDELNMIDKFYENDWNDLLKYIKENNNLC